MVHMFEDVTNASVLSGKKLPLIDTEKSFELDIQIIQWRTFYSGYFGPGQNVQHENLYSSLTQKQADQHLCMINTQWFEMKLDFSV